jgi:hypothetical protein
VECAEILSQVTRGLNARTNSASSTATSSPITCSRWAARRATTSAITANRTCVCWPDSVLAKWHLAASVTLVGDSVNITISKKRLDDFCRKLKVAELSAFGSVVRDDFRPDSDVDLLVRFPSDTQWSLYDWTDMIGELREFLGHKVDLLSLQALRNPFRRREILKAREILYAARGQGCRIPVGHDRCRPRGSGIRGFPVLLRLRC